MRRRDGGPAIEHAYAATTYQAQGATVDTAFVMADPSMDRQEFYVATSRTREQTYLYATPEIQFDRDEFAPRSPHLREGLDHIAEAAERDGSQVSAHDEALRQEFAGLPTDELARRVRELQSEARAERHNEDRYHRAEETISREAERLELFRSHPGRVHPANEQSALERFDGARADREQLPEVRHEARAKAAVAEHLLAERERAAATAARLSPPDYIRRDLGERPSDPSKAQEWDKAVRRIESYRVRNGIVDRVSALGAKPREPAEQAEQRQVRERLQHAQRQLGCEQQRSTERSADLGMGR